MLEPYDVVAHNTDTDSSNRIHDDETARRFGFRGGLVPGVDVYAYLSHPPMQAWGRRWLEAGGMTARFHQPVYDGDAVTVLPADGALEIRGPDGALRAHAVPDEPGPRESVDDVPLVATIAREDRPPASPESLAVGTVFALAPHRFDAEVAHRYLDDVREQLPLLRDEGFAHPAWILRDANHVLSANVELGPWIHVESEVIHHGVVVHDDEVSARARVTREWEHKGHRFVEIAVVHLAGGRRVASTRHVAIYRPRQVAEHG
jgi:acyl dehydratase